MAPNMGPKNTYSMENLCGSPVSSQDVLGSIVNGRLKYVLGNTRSNVIHARVGSIERAKQCQHAQRHATLIASGSNDGTNRGRQYRHLSQKVKDLFEKYSAGELTTTHYLRACGKLYGPPDME
ncbi:hypothetical protein DPMN_058197 [Dreissena polymorpha]|uniref:Uncharacterized protein n=1 Tax=Dreissena polymorpha TaxID=45954 RepID=A0A9D4C1K7_DREPO|nr:hypothetical protein DPMN_058197 [Dreissena polymorpha]